MGFGWNASLQRHLHSQKHGPLIVLQDERQDVDHLTITTLLLEQMLLQIPERIGKFSKRCSVAQGAGFALDDGQIVPPVIDRLAWSIMRPIDNAMIKPSAATTTDPDRHEGARADWQRMPARCSDCAPDARGRWG